MKREGIETQKKAVGVKNNYRIKSVKRTEIQTAWGKRDMALKKPNVSRKQRLKLSRQKYTVAKADDESPNNIASVEDTVSVAQGVVQGGGVIHTAVGGTRNTAGRIQTAIKNGVRVGSVKDVGRTVGSAGTAFKNISENAVKEGGHSLLRTKIDKSTTTDTGTEDIKQGLTEIRYADNARKAVYNTAQGGIKTAQSIKETPKAVKNDVQKVREKIIRKNRAKQAQAAKKTGKAAGAAAKKTGGLIGKIVTSKGFIVVAIGGGLILLVVILVSGFLSTILSAISSMLSWSDSNDDDVSTGEYLQAYHTQVQEIVSEIQSDLDGEFEYTPEYRYDGTEITSLNQYGNTTLSVDENAVIAAAAAMEFQNGNNTLSDDTFREVIEKFYEYTRSTSSGYCPDSDCMKDESVELNIEDGDFYVSDTTYVASDDVYAVTFKGDCYTHTSSVWTDLSIGTSDGTITGSAYANVNGSEWEVTFNMGSDSYDDIDWDDITIYTTTIYCDNPDHTIYTGEVTNFDAETALVNLGFDEDGQDLFWFYCEYVEQGGL